ncbi:MAG: MoaD/ThiS family protein [Actinomycetaceae bacterium]|nr:MoaD/ThiS family protein [Actinomycetaceae bacterium]
MLIHLRFFAGVAAAIGLDEVSLEIPEGGTLGDLVQELNERFGAEDPERLATILSVSSFLVEGRRADVSDPLADGQRVDVLPPFAGG